MLRISAGWLETLLVQRPCFSHSGILFLRAARCLVSAWLGPFRTQALTAVPKGGIEWDETPAAAAVRETREEAGVTGALVAGGAVGSVRYRVEGDGASWLKRVDYVAITGAPTLGPLPGARATAAGSPPPRWPTCR